MALDLENELLTLIGHRFRRNLITITDLANSVLSENEQKLVEATIDDLGQIKTEAADLLDLVDDILRLASSADAPNQLTVFDDVSLLDDIAQAIEVKVALSHKRLAYHNETPGIMLRCDPHLLTEIVSTAASALCQLSYQLDLRFTVTVSGLMLMIQLDDGEFDCASGAELNSVILQRASLVLFIDLLNCVRMVKSIGGTLEMCSGGNTKMQHVAFRIQFPIILPHDAE